MPAGIEGPELLKYLILRTAVAKWPPSIALFSVSRRENVMSSDDRSNRARASNLLKKRIEINYAYSSTDFDARLLDTQCAEGRRPLRDLYYQPPSRLVDLAARFSEIPPEVEGPLRFGPTVLKPYFEKNFVRYDVHHFHNLVSVPSTDILIEFYRQTTYYDAFTEEKDSRRRRRRSETIRKL
jgi:hypothetical protein